jgi:hypothetical protein
MPACAGMTVMVSAEKTAEAVASYVIAWLDRDCVVED